jgi:hypothetical protein
MAEFALRIVPEIVRKEKYDEISPAGAVLSGFSDRLIRRKWVEMVCDLARPALTYKGKRLPSKREKFFAGMVANCGWTQARCDAVAALWSESLWRRWMETEHNSPDVDTAKAQLWDGDIASASGWVAAVGKEPHGVEGAVNCVPWSLDNLKRFYMVAGDGLNDTEAESLHGKKLDVVDFREALMPRHVINWEVALGLTEQAKAEIRDPSIAVHPRFDRKVVRGQIREYRPNVAGIRDQMRA